MYLWSSGRKAYTAVSADLLGVADLLCACFGKRHEPEVGLAFALDDDSSLVEVCGGYLIEPFRGDPSH